MKVGRGAAPCGSLRGGTPSTLLGLAKRNLRPRALRFGWGFLHSVPDRRARRAVRSNSEPGCRVASGGCPAASGLSFEKTSSIFVKLVAFPLGFWWRAPLGLIVVRHGRGMQSAPADDSTSQERAARANDGKALPLAWRDDTILSYLAFCYQNSTRCPYSTVPATSTISGAPHSSTCNFLARTQR